MYVLTLYKPNSTVVKFLLTLSGCQLRWKSNCETTDIHVAYLVISLSSTCHWSMRHAIVKEDSFNSPFINFLGLWIALWSKWSANNWRKDFPLVDNVHYIMLFDQDMQGLPLTKWFEMILESVILVTGKKFEFDNLATMSDIGVISLLCILTNSFLTITNTRKSK